MSQKLQPVRGTHDILPEEATRRRFLERALARVAERYGFGEIATPVFEFSDVFHRTLGDTSDVVTKETYTFEDRGGESITLRPEFTAAVVRAFISNGLQEKLPFKAYYCGPAFRYERPQKGRLRQFHQFGTELLGVAEPIADIETIAMAHQMLSALGLIDHVQLELNSLGDAESRAAYRAELVAYFSGHEASLSEDSKIRLHKNPLRILDSKDEGDRKIVANVPRAADYFTPAASDFISQVRESLTALNIPYVENPRLVRGLDYYQHTVFEFTTTQLGAQGTVLAGGRYDGLVKLMGGPDVPGVGWAAGIERLLALTEATCGHTPGFVPPPPPVAVIPFDDAQLPDALKLAQELRHKDIPVELITRGNMGKKMKRAEGAGALLAFILGPDEVANNTVAFKDMKSRSQSVIARDAVLSAVSGHYKDIK
ncbi:MAG: histidine--tRNA ligase [Proteobacteria bacterium]|nr:histidine--tRNA ligase [Pseudomonadota bacterium]